MSGRDFAERDIHLAMDGELPAEDLPGFSVWLDANPDMKAKSMRFEADRAALRRAFAGSLAESVPDRLGNLVRGESARPRTRLTFWRAAAAAAIFAAGGLGGYLLGNQAALPPVDISDGRRIAQEAIEAHLLYAAEKLHVVEVAADQSEHLLGWLSKRVGLSLIAPDFSSQGLTFLGGRLLPAGGGKAAQFMYQDDAGNRVSLYVTAERGGADTGFRLMQSDGANSYYWVDDGYGCAVTGSMPADKLLILAKSAYKQLLGGAQS